MTDQVHKYGPTDENTSEVMETLGRIVRLLESVDKGLDDIDGRLGRLETSTGELTEFTTGMANAINDAKSGKGMGAMMANMLPTLPVFGQKV